MLPGCRCSITLTAKPISNSLQICSCSEWNNERRAYLMRILFCNKYNFRFSGTEVYLFELMDLLRAQGHEVALFAMADPRGESTAYDRHFVPHIDFKRSSGVWQKARNAGHAI